MDEASKIVWLVGGKKSDAREYRRLLEESQQLHLIAVALRPTVEDYADLAANPETGAVLVCDALARRSDEAYSTATLTAFLRTLRAELPIFVLAEEDRPDDDPAADGVIAGRELRKQPEIFVARLLRAIGRYTEALSVRQRRLQTLLDRQVDGQLGTAEAAELAGLRADHERAARVKLAKQADGHEVDLAEKRQLVDQLQELASRLERRNRGRS